MGTYRRFCKKVLPLLLSVSICLNTVLTSYAMPVASPSDANLNDAGDSFEFDMENLPDDYYSDTDAVYLNYDVYADIEYTFDEYPSSVIGTSRQRSITISSALAIFVTSVAGAYGISLVDDELVSYVTSAAESGIDSMQAFADGVAVKVLPIAEQMEIYLRKNFYTDNSVMQAWQDIVNGNTDEYGAISVGGVLGDAIGSFFRSCVVKGNTVSFNYGAMAKGEPFFPDSIYATNANNVYLTSCIEPAQGSIANYCDYYTSANYLSGSNPFVAFVIQLNSDSPALFSAIYKDGSVFSSKFYCTTGQYNIFSGYFGSLSNSSTSSVSSASSAVYSIIAGLNALGFPVFSSSAAAVSYAKYGTTGGEYLLDDGAISVSVGKIYSDLRDNVDGYRIGDTIKLPTKDNLLSILTDITGATGVDSFIKALSPVIAVSKIGDIEIPSESETSESGGGAETGLISSILSFIIKIFDSVSELPSILRVISALVVNIDTWGAGLADIADWDIDNWIASGVSTLVPGIDLLRNIDDVLKKSIAAWDFSNLASDLVATLSNIDIQIGALSIEDLAGSMAIHFDPVLNKLIGGALGAFGLTWLSDMSLDLSAIFDWLKDFSLSDVLSALGLASLDGLLTNVVDWLKSFDLEGILQKILTTLGIGSIAGILSQILNKITGSDDEKSDSSDSSLWRIFGLLLLVILILVMLLVCFLNCLRLIVLIFNVPASTALLNEDVLKGIEFLKNLQVPLFEVSLFDLLMSVVFFVIIMQIMRVLRKHIDYLKVK